MPIAIELSDGEREMLARGLNQWGGPARCTEALAVAMDFASVTDLLQQSYRLIDQLRANESLSVQDWRRALVAVEIVYASGVFGAGIDWEPCTGYSDEETVALLRSVQRKVARALPRGTYRFRRE